MTRRGWGAALAGLRAQGKIPPAAKKKPRNAHADLCARKGGKKYPCTCGAAERSKALEREILRRLAEVGVTPDASDLVDGAGSCFIPGRLFRADALFRTPRLIVEVQGWAGGYGPHGGIAKAKADVEKHQLAAAWGWRVLPVTAFDIRSGAAVALVLAALAWRPDYGTLPTSAARPSAEA